MTDMLREAIKIARERASKDGEDWWTIAPAHLSLLADAAESTLPKPVTKLVWRLQPEGWPFEDFPAIAPATHRAGHWLAQDIEVSIRKTTVPA
jgi:hypothetical protein